MENTPTPTPATCNGWSTRETWRFALELADIWDIPALYRAHGRDVHRTARALETSARETDAHFGGALTRFARSMASDWLTRVDFVQIVEENVEGEQ